MFTHPDLRRWLPSERLVAGNDSGGFVFDQRIVTKALRDIGPFAFLEDGEPFAGCLFHEMVIADGRKMSKHLGNVVDPDELVERYGADTVRLAVLYAARPGEDPELERRGAALRHRFLTQLVGLRARIALRGARESAPVDEEAGSDTEFLRERLGKWCENGVARITDDMEELEMHNAVRNVMRLFDRIQDFEKRVVKRARPLSPRRREALPEALGPAARAARPVRPAHRRGAVRRGRQRRGRCGPAGRGRRIVEAVSDELPTPDAR